MNFFTCELLVHLIAAILASVAFSVLFHVSPRHLHIIAICSGITYFLYYTSLYFGSSPFTAALLSTMLTALVSEIAARARRAPTIVFLIPSLIPTVPGAGLYNTMHHAISGNWEASLSYLSTTLQIALGISGGIVFVSVTFGLVVDYLHKKKTNRTP